jgi:hypothetical protein
LCLILSNKFLYLCRGEMREVRSAKLRTGYKKWEERINIE